MGINKTYNKIRDRFYFNNMRKYVELFVLTCPECQKVKDPAQVNKSKYQLGEIETIDSWDLVSIDLWGPRVRSLKGNKYCLSVVDGFTKKPLRSRVFCNFWDAPKTPLR